MLRLRIGLGIIFIASAVNARAAVYYVDQIAGNDGNNGTSVSTAWKNAPGMSSYTGSGALSPGDTVNFNRAGIWVVTGQQGLYLVGGVTYVGDSWGPGTRRAVIRAGADLVAGVVRFRDHPTFETVFRGFEVDAAGIFTNGIDINHAFFVAPQTGATKRVQDTEVHGVASRLINGQYAYGVIVSDHGGAAGEVDNVEIVNTVVHDVSRDAICLYPGDESATSTIKNITVRGSEAYNTGQDPDYCCGAGILIKGFVQGAFIEYNYIHDVKGASVFMNGNETNHFPGVGLVNIHIRYNIITNSTANGAIRIYDGASGGDTKDVKVYGNIVYNSTVNGGLLLATDLKNSLNLLVYNNTFYDAPVIVQRLNITVNAFEFRNNIVYSSGSSVPLTDDRPSMTAHSNNIYFRASGTLVSSGGTSYSSSNLSSYEASGSSGNPLFVNPASLPTGFAGTYAVNLAPNSAGLSLQPSSIGAGRGFALPAAYANSINSVGRLLTGPWDIGAYQAGGTETPPSPPQNLQIQAR